jgi:hypothetical protein
MAEIPRPTIVSCAIMRRGGRQRMPLVPCTPFNGRTSNYDGFGRDAAGNNTLVLAGWVAFRARPTRRPKISHISLTTVTL